MTSIDVIQVREALETEQADLQRQIGELDISTDAAADFDENFADSGQVAAEQGENQVLLGTFRDQLAEVEAAIVRIDEGTYGRCEECGTEITPPRLEAMPSTRYCIDHA
jgi:DnaK suppressor protein